MEYDDIIFSYWSSLTDWDILRKVPYKTGRHFVFRIITAAACCGLLYIHRQGGENMNNKELYQEKLVSAKAVAERIQDGWTVCTDIATAIPPAILNALGEEAKAGNKKGITLHTMLDLSPYSFLEEEAAAGIRPVSWFSGKGLAKAVNDGRADVMSCYYMDMPALFSEYIDIDALVIVTVFLPLLNFLLVASRTS